MSMCDPFFRAEGERGRTSKRQNGPNRKCQHFPVIYRLIHAVFSGRGFLGILNAMVKFKIFLPVTDGFVAFSHFNLHHLSGHPKKPLSCENGTNRSVKCRKMLALSVWQLNRKWSHFELDRCIQHPVKPGKINQLQSGKYCTSCLAAKQEVKPFWTSPLIAFSIPRNSLPEKTARINQSMTGKCWHFLFGLLWHLEVWNVTLNLSKRQPFPYSN